MLRCRFETGLSRSVDPFAHSFGVKSIKRHNRWTRTDNDRICAIFRSACRHPRWSLTFVGHFGPSKRPSRNSTKPCKMESKRVDKSTPGANVLSTSDNLWLIGDPVRICWSVYCFIGRMLLKLRPDSELTKCWSWNVSERHRRFWLAERAWLTPPEVLLKATPTKPTSTPRQRW